jgi:hypothetical protein
VFESWLPRSVKLIRYVDPRPVRSCGPRVVAYVLFFLAGLAFGYAAPGLSKWVPLIFPLGLAAIAAIDEGIDGTFVVRLIVALLITVLGVLLGALLDRRGAGQRPRPA